VSEREGDKERDSQRERESPAPSLSTAPWLEIGYETYIERHREAHISAKEP